MDTIFTVKKEDLARLSPEEAVDFFRELLWAEATALGIGKNLIDVPSAITVADGGIDAEVRDVLVDGAQGLIKPGLTRYQIKTGDFSLRGNTGIDSILCGEKSKALRPKIKSCIAQEGTFVVVLFGSDKPDITDEKLRDKLRDRIRTLDAECADARLEVWRQNTLRGFLVSFPSLALRLTGRDRERFQTHRSWSQQDDMRRDFKAGPSQVAFITGLQNELRRNDEAVHARVWGEAGIGKTRLVLEATAAKDLGALVVYCGSAERFRDSDLMNVILRDDNSFHVVLVVDECDRDASPYLWNAFKHCGPRIKLVSIYMEYDKTSGNISYHDAPALDSERVSEIIQDYGIVKDQADRWSELCGGYPRVAHLIGQNLKNNPEDLLRSPDTVNVWERYIVGSDDPNSPRVAQRRVVLRHIALFKRFGYGRPVVQEAKAIAAMVERVDPQITWGRFQEIVRELRARRLLQGETTLYISSKLFHIWLWTDWWDTHGTSFALVEFSRDLPPRMMEWFLEMFKYAAESEVAARVVSELLSEGGPFGSGEFLRTKLGARFFLALSEADPKSSLNRLSATVGTWDRERLTDFETGRREVIWTLERIAVWRHLFAGAARLLLALGEAENESWANNASGVFVGLFVPGYGPVAPTEAAPEERFPVLNEALSSVSSARRAIALRACDAALESQHWVRMVGMDQQGLGRQAKLWRPQTYGELFDAYRRVWGLLRERLDTLPQDEQREAAKIILQRSRGLGRNAKLADMVIDTVKELVDKPYVSKKAVLEKVVELLHYDGKDLPAEPRQRWEQIRDQLTGDDYSALMRRYVGMDLLEDSFDEEGNRVDQVQPHLESLALQSVDNPALLKGELSWLVTADAENGYRFGYELGKRDHGFTLLPQILASLLEAGTKGSSFFVGGFLRAFREANEKSWEEYLDTLAADEQLSVWVPELTWRSGLTDRAALRILQLAKAGRLTTRHFHLFRFGGLVRSLSEGVFQQWVEFLLASPDSHVVSTALDLYDFYYMKDEEKGRPPQEQTFGLLTHEAFFRKPDEGKRDQMDDYHWATVGKAFVRLYPARSLALAEVMIRHFGEDDTVLGAFHSTALTVLSQILSQKPSETWSLIAAQLGPPIDSRAFDIKEWLRGGEFYAEGPAGALSLVPAEEVWRWVDADIEKRAWYVASFVPPLLFQIREKLCLAREVLVRYGDRQDVRRSLMANFSTEGWSGPESLHHEKKKQGLLDFREEEENERVRRWLDEYVAALDKEIEQAKIREEREDW